MPRLTYIAGVYLIKYKGRGVIKNYYTAPEIKTLFKLMNTNRLEIESIQNEEYPIN